MEKKIKSRKLNPFTEKKNDQPPVEIEEAKIVGEEVELPETKVMVPVKSFAMPLATVNQVKEAMRRYQEFNRALLTTKDLYEVVDKKTGEKKMIAKKSGFAKLGRFWGVSTEILRSFTEEKEVLKDKWGYNQKSGKSYLIAKKGDKYLLAKAWAKAILPNGQFAVRGAAIAETERNFAHLDHDLLATSETRAVKRATEAVIGMGEILTEDDIEKEEFKEVEQKPKEKKTYKPKPSQEQGYKHTAVTRPEMPATPKQKDYINAMIERLKNTYGLETQLEKPVDQLNKGEAANLISKLLVKGKKAKEMGIKKEIPKGEPPFQE